MPRGSFKTKKSILSETKFVRLGAKKPPSRGNSIGAVTTVFCESV